MGQKENFFSIIFKPEFQVVFLEKKSIIKASFFLRTENHQSKRNHFDIRELYLSSMKNDWKVEMGLKKIFWGVLEGGRIVDIINQNDWLEGFDRREKLGQPLFQLSKTSAIGVFNLYLSPYFRKIEFLGLENRFRTAQIITAKDILFESKYNEYHLDVALRWKESFKKFDVGISYFYGTGRNPIFHLINAQNQLIYPINHQLGIEVQYLLNNFDIKLETAYVRNNFEVDLNIGIGGEYSFSNIYYTGLDINLVLEYYLSTQKDISFYLLDNDLFLGSKINFNNPQNLEILLGAYYDFHKKSFIFSGSVSSRLFKNLTANLSFTFLNASATTDLIYFFKDDSFLQLTLSYFF